MAMNDGDKQAEGCRNKAKDAYTYTSTREHEQKISGQTLTWRRRRPIIAAMLLSDEGEGQGLCEEAIFSRSGASRNKGQCKTWSLLGLVQKIILLYLVCL